MANKVTQLALVTAAICARMENTMVASKLVEWKKNDTNLTPLNKFQYIEQVPPRYNRRQWTGEVSDLSAGKQDTVFGSEIYQLNQGDTLDFFYGDFENIRDFDAARKNSRIRSIGQNEGQLVDADVLKTASMCGNNWIGTPGTAVTDVEDIMKGYARLMENGVPDVETDIFCVLPHTDKPALAKYLQELPGPDAFTTDMVVRAKIKELASLPILFTQQLPVLTTGTRTNGAVNGASQSVNYRNVCSSTTTNGQFLTQTIAVDGFGANATIKDGEVFTIAGVNAYDNRKQASQGRLQQFRVVGNFTADGTGAVAALRIFPAIIIPGGAVTGDTGVDTANATCTAAPADNAVITWVGSASTDYLQRALIKRTAVRIETASLEDLPSGENAQVEMEGIPLSLRSYKYANGDTGASSVRFDIPWQSNITPNGRWEVVRING
jgi:hypothetical protein